MRTCTACGVTKELEEFAIRKDRPCGRVSRCKKCSVAYALAHRDKATEAKKRAEHRKKRPDLASANAKRFSQRHPEYAKAQADRIRKWNSDNPGRAKEARDRYRRSHPERARFDQQVRRAKLRMDGGSLSKGLVEVLMSEQGGKCPYCLLHLSSTGFHLDHVVPVSRGGKHEDNNIQLLCPKCNRMKSAKDHVTFYRERIAA